MKNWTEIELSQLPEEDGFRLRGYQMTRLETLTDAVFAFAITLLVISVGTIPSNITELIAALKGAPAFLLASSAILLFWSTHRSWSRNYGMGDNISQLLTFGLIFTVLIYVYPLRLMASSLLALMSGDYFPSEFSITNMNDAAVLFIIYGAGFTAISSLFTLLFYRAYSHQEILNLSYVEKRDTVIVITVWGICGITALASTMMAALTAPHIAVFSGFVYCTLPMTIPLSMAYLSKRNH